MYRIQLSWCKQPFSDTTVIAGYNHQETSSLQKSNSLRDSLQKLPDLSRCSFDDLESELAGFPLEMADL